MGWLLIQTVRKNQHVRCVILQATDFGREQIAIIAITIRADVKPLRGRGCNQNRQGRNPNVRILAKRLCKRQESRQMRLQVQSPNGWKY